MSGQERLLPVAAPESRPFWEGCRRHELLLQRCLQCRAFWWPPGVLCPECWGTSWEWARATGQGTIYSFVIYQRVYHPGWADQVPYVVAVVELEEGPRMTSNVIGCPVSAVRCGMSVEVVFEDVAAEVALPRFRPGPGSHVGLSEAEQPL